MDHSVVGLVCARKGSKRLPMKNTQLIQGVPLAVRATQMLALSSKFEEIALATDIDALFGLEQVRGVILKRPDYLNTDECPLQYVVKYAVDAKGWEGARAIVVLMPTNPWITTPVIDRAIQFFLDGNFDILRSYDPETSQENGLYVMKPSLFASDRYRTLFYDVHTGAIFVHGKEIHTADDYAKAKFELG